jgi:hypothetical protein
MSTWIADRIRRARALGEAHNIVCRALAEVYRDESMRPAQRRKAAWLLNDTSEHLYRKFRACVLGLDDLAPSVVRSLDALMCEQRIGYLSSVLAPKKGGSHGRKDC